MPRLLRKHLLRLCTQARRALLLDPVLYDERRFLRLDDARCEAFGLCLSVRIVVSCMKLLRKHVGSQVSAPREVATGGSVVYALLGRCGLGSRFYGALGHYEGLKRRMGYGARWGVVIADVCCGGTSRSRVRVRCDFS
jgi:hypothetical protein